MADLKQLIDNYAALSDSERNLLKKEMAAAEQKRKDAKEAAEAKAVALAKAQAKLGSDALFGDVAAKMRELQKALKALKAAASPAGAKAAQEVSDALGRAGGLLASGASALTLNGEERAMLPAPAAKKAAPRSK